MRRRLLTATIYIVLSLLLVIGNSTAVMAAPGRIEDPSFEAVTNWIYDETDGDYTDGAQSTDGVTQGIYSYKFACTAAGIGPAKYTEIAQTVNFSLLDRFSFDCQLEADQTNFEAQVWADGTKVWSKAVPTTQTVYTHEAVDVSGITSTSAALAFRIENIGGTGNYNMASYFDNIKIWGSHSDATWTTVCNSFSGATNHGYMYGENFDAGSTKVGWYDGNGDWVETDTYLAWGGGVLNWSECQFTDDPSAAAGDWHAVVLLQADDPPATYAAAIADPDFVADDTFNVDATAIPEFPEVMAAIGVAGLCFGIYYRMRN